MHSEIAPKISWAPGDYINAADLNRIENNTGYTAEYFESVGYHISLVLKEDWSSTTIPFYNLTKRIIDNAKAIYALIGTTIPMPEIPNDFSNVTSVQMGNIENYLVTLYNHLQKAMEQAPRCGSLVCGQDASYL